MTSTAQTNPSNQNWSEKKGILNTCWSDQFRHKENKTNQLILEKQKQALI